MCATNWKFGRCKSDLRAELKEKGVTNLTEAQLKNAIDKIEEEHHAILFKYKSDVSLEKTD